MALPPINVFSVYCDPDVVLSTLRACASSVEITESVDGEWRGARVSFDAAGTSLTVRHDPDYYAGPGWSQQLSGMSQYVMKFPNTPAKSAVLRAIRSLGFALSFMGDALDAGDRSDPRVVAILAVCDDLDGFVFTPRALFDAQGRLLVDADGGYDPEAAPPADAPQQDDESEATEAPLSPQRAAVFAALEARGFRPARWLPAQRTAGGRDEVVRPSEEIARRLMALDALFTWVSQDQVDAKRVQAYAERNQLASALTAEERELLEAPREEAAQAQASVGWKLENMWPLAWALGFALEPDVGGAMIDDATMQALSEFLPTFDGTVAELLARATPRAAAEVSAQEDLFYCAHNAVRSAQLGEDTVPEGFHPGVNGGVVHERRHALTWIVSPGVPWDDTDLST